MYIFKDHRAFIVFILAYLLLIVVICSVRASTTQIDVVLEGSYSYTTSWGNTYAGTMRSIPMTIISLVGDVDRNNEVDFTDIHLVRGAYGSFPGESNWNKYADVDGSGEVDFVDMLLVRNAYGEMIEELPEPVFFVMHGQR